MAEALLSQGRNGDARQVLEDALQSDPDSEEARVLLGQLQG